MAEQDNPMFNLDPDSIRVWLGSIDRSQIHDAGWKEVNRRAHPLAMAIRTFIQTEFNPDEQAAAFDGFTVALWAIMHSVDITELNKIFIGNESTFLPLDSTSESPIE